MQINKITSENWQFKIDHAEKMPQGIHLWYKGVPYPRRVMHSKDWQTNHFLRVLDALGNVKKYLFAITYLKGLVIPITFDIKKYEVFLHHSYQLFKWNLEEFYINQDEYSVPVWEMGKFIQTFLIKIGLNEEIALNYTKIAMMILEFDCAYRYRVQDLAGETNKELLKNPRKELKRLLEIYSNRESNKDPHGGARAKITKIDILRQLFFIPKLKNAFLAALKEIDIEKIQFDDNDRFHISFWKGYDFEGKTFDERFTPWEEVYKTIPFEKRDDQQIINNFLLGI